MDAGILIRIAEFGYGCRTLDTNAGIRIWMPEFEYKCRNSDMNTGIRICIPDPEIGIQFNKLEFRSLN